MTPPRPTPRQPTTTAVEVTDPSAVDRRAFPYQPALDGLRALSVMAVIAYHNGYVWAVGGFLGVDAFFVLSGYLITTLLVLEYRRLDTIGLIGFWGRRIRRLLPALLLVLVFAAIYGAILLRPYEIGPLRADSLSSLFYVTNWRFIISGQSYFDLFATPSPLRHLWSLAIEEQFYLVWPVVTILCLRARKGRTDVLAIVAAVGATASVITMSALYRAQAPSRAYYGTDARAHTLLVGALLAILLLRSRPWRVLTNRAVQAGAILIVGVVVWTWHVVNATDAGYYGLGSLAYAIGIAVVIAAVVQAGSPLGRLLGIPPLQWLGRISYGLYLWHWPIIAWLVHWRVGFGDSRLVAVRLVVTFALAIASYYLVELPIRRGRWFRPGSRAARWSVPVAILTTGAILVGATVGAGPPPSYFAGGFPDQCAAPTATELRDARRAAIDQRARLPQGRFPTMAVIGDSVSCSLWPGLAAFHRTNRLEFRMGGVLGCGEASNQVLTSAETTFVPFDTDKCEGLTSQFRTLAVRGHVPVALWVSAWERADLDDNGTRVRAGTPAWTKLLTSRMEKIVRELHARGTYVVFATMPPKAPGEIGNVAVTSSSVEDATYVRLNNLLLHFVATHRDEVAIVDLAGHVCPGGAPCSRVVDGIAPRAVDGTHFTPEGSVWALDWLLPQIRRAEAAARPGA